MTALLAPGRTPQNDAELARSFHDRLRKLETASTVRVGPWVLSNDPATGNLRATRPGTSVELGGSGEPVVVELKGGGVSKEELTSAITGQGDSGDLQIIKRIFANLSNFLSGIDFNDPLFDVENAAQTFVETVVQPLIDAVAALGKLSISWLTNEQQNMVTEGGYDSPATIVVGSGFVHDATDGVPGTLPLGCAKVTADGTDHQMAPKLFEVGQGWQLRAGSRVKWEGLTTSGPDPIRIDIQPYKQTGPDTFDLVGPQLMVASVQTPAAASGGLAGWGTGPIQGTWTVPSDGSVSHVALLDHVTGAALSGSVKYDQTFMYPIQDIPQEWVNGLIAQLTSLYDWIETWVLQGLAGLGITPTGTLNDMINDLADGLSDIQNAAEDAIAGLAEKLGLDQWDEQMNELKDIFDGLIVDPLTDLGSVIGGWFGQFFRGGPKQVVTQDQVAQASGIPPTDADITIPWTYLPPELTSAALGHPWTVLTKLDQSIPVGVATKLTGWIPAGGLPLTFLSDRFTVQFPGLFSIEAFIKWSSFAQNYAKLTVLKNGVVQKYDKQYGSSLSIVDANNIYTEFPVDAGDYVEIQAEWAGTGTTKDVTAADTFVKITYRGDTNMTATPIVVPTTTFDATGAGAYGTDDGQGWAHTFGALSNTIVIPISHGGTGNLSEIDSVTVGPHTVPILSGPTLVGNYFGFGARYSLAAAILPTSVRGTTQPVQVNFIGIQAASANSMSFNGVSYIGTPRVSSGNGTARLMVPSNSFSMVAGGFGGMDVNFGTMNRTTTFQRPFSAGNYWAHVMGYSTGGLEFVVSAGRWAGKFVELHP